jgi:hypothetical protein
MAHGAQLSVTELRRSARHPVNYSVVVEHKVLGEMNLHIANISAHGFMSEGEMPLSRGDRLQVRLPGVGRIEAYLIWNTGGRIGFQFERIIRIDDFNAMIAAMQPNSRLCRER